MGKSAAAGGALFAAEALARIRAPAAEAVAGGDVPGALALVWRAGDLVALQAEGLRDIDAGLPMERGTIFGIASMTKPVTVAAALRLAEQGRLALQDPISRWAPEFADMRVLRRADGPLDKTDPAPREITVLDLMTHRSGLAYGFLTPGPLGVALMQTFGMGIDSAMGPDAWMQALAALPLARAPGDGFQYGHSTDVLGFVIGRAAGSSLREVLRTELFEPLGMPDTDFWIPPDKRSRAATAYTSAAPGGFTPVAIGGFTGTTPPAYTSGGQGLVSTADDYLRFARMLLAGGTLDGVRVLTPESVRLMTTDHLTPDQRLAPFMGMPFWASQGFGLGVSVVTDPVLHDRMGAASAGAFGWPGAFGGWWQADPAEDMVLIWLQQVLPAPPAPGALPRLPGARATAAFQKAVYAAVRG